MAAHGSTSMLQFTHEYTQYFLIADELIITGVQDLVVCPPSLARYEKEQYLVKKIEIKVE